MAPALGIRKQRTLRKPDANILGTIESIRAQKDSKRMVIFSLRTLGELCSPNSRAFCDNVHECVLMGVVADLHAVILLHQSDLEICASMVKIFKSLLRFLVVDPDIDCRTRAVEIDKLVPDVITSLMRLVLNCTSNLSNIVWEDAIAILTDLSKTALDNHALEIDLLPELLCVLSSPQLTPPIGSLLCMALQTFTLKHTSHLRDAQLPFLLLTACDQLLSKMKNRASDKIARDFLLQALGIVGLIAGEGYEDDKAVKANVSLLEKCAQMGPAVDDAARRVLRNLVKPSQFERISSRLKSGLAADREVAVSLLAAIAFIEATRIWTVGHVWNELAKVVGIYQSGGSHVPERSLRGVIRMLSRLCLLDNRAPEDDVLLGNCISILCKLDPQSENADLAADLCTLVALLAGSNKLKSPPDSLLPVLLGLINTKKSAEVVRAAASVARSIAKSAPALMLKDGSIATEMAHHLSITKDPMLVLHCAHTFFSLVEHGATVGVTIEWLPWLMKGLLSLESKHYEAAEACIVLLKKIAEPLAGKNQAVEKAFVQAGVSETLLSVGHVFKDHARISTLCTQLLGLSAQESDVAAALSTLEASGSNSHEVGRAFTTLGGLSRIDHLRHSFGALNVEQAVIRGLETLIKASPSFPEQAELVSSGFECLRMVHTRETKNSGDLCVAVLHMANGASMKSLVQKQSSADSNSLLDAVRCVDNIVKLDSLNGPAWNVKILEGISGLMRKYPEQRKVQVTCLELLLDLLTCKSADLSEDFIKIGSAKQVLSFLLKAAHHEDVQRVGFKVLIACATKSSKNIESLCNAGAVDVIKSTARTQQNKPDIQKDYTALYSMLVPESQTNDEVSESISQLKIAGKNRDLSTGRRALESLASLTAASDAAKHACRSGVSEAMQSFLRSLQSPPATPFADLQVSASSAIMVVTNIGNVGKPHSSAVVKQGGLHLLRNILAQSKDVETPAVFAAALRAGQVLLSHEKNPLQATGAREFLEYLIEVLPNVSDDTNLMMPVVAAMGMLGAREDPNFNKAIEKMGGMLLAASSADEKRKALICIRQVFSVPNSSGLATIFAESGGCDAVLKMLDEDPETAMLARLALERLCAAAGDGSSLRQALIKRGGAGAVARACKAVGRNLGSRSDDSEASLSAIKMLTAFTVKMAGSEFTACDLMGVVDSVIEAHPECRPLRAAVGDLLSNLDSGAWLDRYFEEVIRLLTDIPEGFQAALLKVLRRLDIFIPCRGEQDDVAYAKAPTALALLASYLPQARGDPQMLPAIPLIAWRLIERFESRSSPFGIEAVAATMMSTLIDLVHMNDPSSLLRKSSAFLIHTFNILDAFCVDAVSFSHLKPLVLKESILSDAWTILERYAKDPEVVSPIVRFLGHFSSDEETVEAVELARSQTVGARQFGENSESGIYKIVQNFRRSPDAVENGLEAIGRMIAKKHVLNKTFVGSENLADIEELAFASAQGAAGYGSMIRLIASRPDIDHPEQMVTDALELLIKKWRQSREDPELPIHARQRLASEIALLTREAASRGNYLVIRKNNVINVLADAACLLPNSTNTIRHIAEAFGASAENDDLCSTLLTVGCPVLVADCSAVLQNDLEASFEGLSLILRLMKQSPEKSQYMRDVNGLLETLEGAGALAVESSESGTQLLEVVNSIRAMLQDSLSKALTLEEIYRRWSHRQERGDTLDLAEGVQASEMDFVFDTTEEYSKEILADIRDTLAREFSFGCLNFGLIHELPDNVTWCIRRGEQDFFMRAMESQPVDELVQYIINGNLAALTLGQHALAWAAVDRCAIILAEMLRRGAAWALENREKKEAFLIKRLEFMERCCRERTFFNDSSALDVMVELWEKVEEGVYSIGLLKAIVRLLRAMVNPHWTKAIIKHRISERLIERVEDSESPYNLLADVLFCLGTMASVLALKNQIGELEGVERIVELLRKCEKEKPSADVSRTQQNACLALGNLVLGHGLNANAFGNAGGVDLVVRVMRWSMTDRIDFDLANAASVLMCNVSFRRDDFKEALGCRGAPQAILLSIHRYDGTASDNVFRCLTSMFKAITNLALIPENVTRFLEANITVALAHFYSHGESLPDELVLHSLKTLSNLTLENTEMFMKEFGELLPALCSLVQSTQRSDAEMLCFVLETFASLCRWEQNRRKFTEMGGVEVVVGYLNSIKHESIYERGLELMAVLAYMSKAADAMVRAGIYSFVLLLIDDSEDLSADLVVTALKVIRRLITHSRLAANVFVDAGPMPLLCDMLVGVASLANRDCPSALTALECLRILLHLLHVNPAPYGVETDESLLVITENIRHSPSIKSQSFTRLFQSGRAHADSISEDSSFASPPDTPPNQVRHFGSITFEGSPVALNTPCRSQSIHQALRKPRGPRGYDIISLDAKRCLTISRALFRMLTEQDAGETLRLDRLTEYALVLIAYMSAEKIDGIASAFTANEADLSSFVQKAFGQTKAQYGEAKLRMIYEASEFLANLLGLMHPDAIKALSVDLEAMDALKQCSNALSTKRENSLKRKVQEIYALLNYEIDELQPSLFFGLATYDFPLETVDFAVEPYPNGVQDLQPTMRQKIRRGGRCQCVVVDEDGLPTIQPVWWKSSTDLS